MKEENWPEIEQEKERYGYGIQLLSDYRYRYYDILKSKGNSFLHTQFDVEFFDMSDQELDGYLRLIRELRNEAKERLRNG